MARAAFLLALIVPFAPRPPQSAPPLQLEVVGPSVLMNHARDGKIAVFDLRAQGRSVPGATKNLAAPFGNAPIFALGEPETARKWAETRDLKAVYVVPPHLIEFHAMPNVPQIAPREANEKVSRQNWPIFDLSEPIEFNSSRLPRSRRLDFIDFQRGKLEQLPKNRPFIVACRVGHRSQLVTKKLRELGYDARNLDGGLWAWQVDSLPLEGNKR